MAIEWRLVLAGSQGYDAAETLSAIKASPARDRIRVTGYISTQELAAWYGRARIFAFPSFDEGFGMPVLEAMAAGIPVIAGNRSSLPEVAGDAALLIDPREVDDLARAISQLATSLEAQTALIARGKERAKAFTWPRAVAETLGIYRELL